MSPTVDAGLKQRENQVKARPMPRHIGIIMDGNGRWAEAHGRPRIEGHREGSNSVRDVTRCARRLGIDALTLYAFSSQNWHRPSLEVAGLMDLLREYLIKEREEILDNQIRLNAVGDLDKLPAYVRDPLEALRRESAHHKGMVLTLALSYGGREELLRAARVLAAKVQAGRLDADKLCEHDLERELWTAGLPDVDLIVRTSGENRVSNFLLWQGAYAEYVFVDTLWPDFRAHSLLDCIERFQGRERRYGLTSAQLRALP
jgi:undecaprenyl diphosphate synthase